MLILPNGITKPIPPMEVMDGLTTNNNTIQTVLTILMLVMEHLRLKPSKKRMQTPKRDLHRTIHLLGSIANMPFNLAAWMFVPSSPQNKALGPLFGH